MRSRRSTRRDVATDLAKGAIAGAIATWVMDRVTATLYRREDRWARRREEDARGGKRSHGVAAGRAAGAVRRTLNDTSRQRLGSSLHWAVGVGSGAVYAVLRRRFGRVAGVGFGTMFWAAVEEGMVPALGLTPRPGTFPWQMHARGLAGHLTFGSVTDGTLRLLDAVI